MSTVIYFILVCKSEIRLAGWHTPLFPVLRRQRQADLYKFQFSLVYIVSPWPARDT